MKRAGDRCPWSKPRSGAGSDIHTVERRTRSGIDHKVARAVRNEVLRVYRARLVFHAAAAIGLEKASASIICPLRVQGASLHIEPYSPAHSDGNFVRGQLLSRGGPAPKTIVAESTGCTQKFGSAHAAIGSAKAEVNTVVINSLQALHRFLRSLVER